MEPQEGSSPSQYRPLDAVLWLHMLADLRGANGMRPNTTPQNVSFLSTMAMSVALAGFTTLDAVAQAPIEEVVSSDTASQPFGQQAFESLNDRLDSLERDNGYLQAEIDQLRQEAGQEWLTEKRATEIRGLVQDVLADSEARTSLQDSAATAGWDSGRGFYLRSADNRFMLQISGMMQARYLWNYSTSGGFTNYNTNPPLQNSAVRNNDNAYGFDLPHTRLVFKGHVFEPGIRFFIRTQFGSFESFQPGTFSTNGANIGALDVLDAYVAFDLDNQWSVRVGQFKLPFSRERLVSVQNLLTADRSSVDTLMSVGRSQGVELSTRTDSFSWAVAVSDGGTDNLLAGISNNSGYFPLGTQPTNSFFWDRQATFAITSRVEFKLSGDWSEFREMTSPIGASPGLLLGLAGHYQIGQAPYGPTPNGGQVYSGGGNNEWISVTADASWNVGGATVYGAIYYSNSETRWSVQNVGTNLPRIRGTTNLIGMILQGSMYMTPKWELFARYQYLDPSTTPTLDPGGNNAAPVEFSPLSIATLGANWYIDGQDLRWSFQVGYAFNEVTMVSGTLNNGFRPLFAGTNELVLLTQLQLQF